MRKPSVLFINRVYPSDPGATGRMLRDLAAGFSMDGWDVTVLATGDGKADGPDGAVKIVRTGSAMRRKGALGYLKCWGELMLAGLRLPAHDLVVTMTDPPLLVNAGGIIAKRKKSRHIHWCQDLYPELLPVLGYEFPETLINFLARSTRKAMKKCDRVIVIGRCMARALIHRGLDSRTLSVIPNWPDRELVETRHPDNGSLPMIRPMNARPADALFRDAVDMKFRVLYAGTLGRAHPVDTVLDAAEILARTNPDIEFVFAGNSGGYEALAAERARRGLENIKLLPRQPSARLRQLMESGDVHLVTMNPDAAGLLVPCKIYAALAASRPCILVGPEHGEAGRVLIDFGAGAVVPQGEAEQLARVVRQFREDSQFWYDAYALRALASASGPNGQPMRFFVANSFSKSMSLYGERCGGLSVVCGSAAEAANVLGQLKFTVRRNYSSPPIHGGQIVARVLGDAGLRSTWEAELGAMRSRMLAMRRRLHDVLAAKLPGRDFGYFLSQHGMFSYTGLTPQQVDRLREEYAVYLIRSGRMCVAGLNTGNVEPTAVALAAVLGG